MSRSQILNIEGNPNLEEVSFQPIMNKNIMPIQQGLPQVIRGTSPVRVSHGLPLKEEHIASLDTAQFGRLKKEQELITPMGIALPSVQPIIQPQIGQVLVHPVGNIIGPAGPLNFNPAQSQIFPQQINHLQQQQLQLQQAQAMQQQQQLQQQQALHHQQILQQQQQHQANAHDYILGVLADGIVNEINIDKEIDNVREELFSQEDFKLPGLFKIFDLNLNGLVGLDEFNRGLTSINMLIQPLELGIMLRRFSSDPNNIILR